MLICDECGAYIDNSIKHAAFHATLNATLVQIAYNVNAVDKAAAAQSTLSAQALRGATVTADPKLNFTCKSCGYDTRLLPHEKQVDCPDCAYGWRKG